MRQLWICLSLRLDRRPPAAVPFLFWACFVFYVFSPFRRQELFDLLKLLGATLGDVLGPPPNIFFCKIKTLPHDQASGVYCV